MTDDRRADVEAVAVMLQGAVWVTLSQVAGEWLRDARAEQATDAEGTVTDYTDVVLGDGWRVRVTWTVVPPVDVDVEPWTPPTDPEADPVRRTSGA